MILECGTLFKISKLQDKWTGTTNFKSFCHRRVKLTQKSQTLDCSVFYLKSIQNIYLDYFYYDLIGALGMLQVNVISAGARCAQIHYPFLLDPVSLGQAPSTWIPCIWVYTAAWSKFHKRNHNSYYSPT